MNPAAGAGAERSGESASGIALLASSEVLTSGLLLPDPNDPLHVPFAEADQRARTTAIASLEAAFPGLRLGRCTQATDATTLTVGNVAPELLAALDGEGMLERLFREFTVLPHVQLALIRDRETRAVDDLIVVEPGAYPGGLSRARSAGIAAALDDGFTVVLNGIELRDPTSVVLAGLFERAFGCSININGYLSARQQTSFGVHWDNQEVVILQLLGRKDWKIEAPTALSMNKDAHGESVSGQPVWQGRIGPGDALYLPRGWGHTVSGINELTYHHTITVPRINGLEILEQLLLDLAGEQETTTPGAPLSMLPGGHPIEALPIDPISADRHVRRILAKFRFNIPRRSVAPLRATIEALEGGSLAGVFVRCPAPGGWTVVDTSEGKAPGDPVWPDALIAGIAGQFIAVPFHHVAAVAQVCDGRVHNAGAVEVEVVRALLELGLLDVVMDPDAWGLTRA